jgi:hypothetical protein
MLGLFLKVYSYSVAEDTPIFMEHESSLLWSQKPTTKPYHEQAESSPHPHTLFFKDMF